MAKDKEFLENKYSKLTNNELLRVLELDKNKNNLLHIACKTGDFENILRLSENFPHLIGQVNSKGNTPIRELQLLNDYYPGDSETLFAKFEAIKAMQESAVYCGLFKNATRELLEEMTRTKYKTSPLEYRDIEIPKLAGETVDPEEPTTEVQDS